MEKRRNPREDQKIARLSRRTCSRERVGSPSRQSYSGGPREDTVRKETISSFRWHNQEMEREEVAVVQWFLRQEAQSPGTPQIPVWVLQLFWPLVEKLPCSLSSEFAEWRLFKRNSANTLDWSCNCRKLHTPCAVPAPGSRTPSTNAPDSTNWVEEQDWRLPKLEDGQGKIQKSVTGGFWEICGLF